MIETVIVRPNQRMASARQSSRAIMLPRRAAHSLVRLHNTNTERMREPRLTVLKPEGCFGIKCDGGLVAIARQVQSGEAGGRVRWQILIAAMEGPRIDREGPQHLEPFLCRGPRGSSFGSGLAGRMRRVG